MKKLLLLLLCVPLIGVGQACQYGSSTDASELCNFIQSRSFATDKNADIALNKILSVTGMSKRFVLKQCSDISNCIATTYKGIRYILYDKEFMDAIAVNTNSWSNLSILAHEIGHHVNGHSLDIIVYGSETVEPPTLSESRQMELVADEFSGFVMYRLGATLYQAQEAVNLICTNEDDTYSTHPKLNKRLAAIEKGYNKAKSQANNDYVIPNSDNNYIEIENINRAKLRYKYLKNGNGQQAYNQMVTFHYLAKLTNGNKFDSSYDRDSPLTVELGKAEIIPGIEKVLQLLRVGDIVKVIIPPKFSNNDTTMIWELELLSVE